METKAETITKKYDSQCNLIEKTTKIEENNTSKMRLKTITKLLIDAYKKDAEDKLWQQWLVLFSGMDRDNFISFEKYKSEFFKPELKKADAKTVLKDAEEIKMADQRGGT